jgi:hypothetical protein
MKSSELFFWQSLGLACQICLKTYMKLSEREGRLLACKNPFKNVYEIIQATLGETFQNFGSRRLNSGLGRGD